MHKLGGHSPTLYNIIVCYSNTIDNYKILIAFFFHRKWYLLIRDMKFKGLLGTFFMIKGKWKRGI